MARNSNLSIVKSDIITTTPEEAVQIAAAFWQAQQAEQRRNAIVSEILKKYAPEGDELYDYSVAQGTFTKKVKADG